MLQKPIEYNQFKFPKKPTLIKKNAIIFLKNY